MKKDKVANYNLGVVVQQTGLKPDTLRAWERRYGIPNPDRSSGKHRLYSDYDIAQIKWLMERQEEGMSISKAVKLWHTVIQKGEDPLQKEERLPVAPMPLSLVGGKLTELCDQWVTACLNFDEQQANQILNQAFGLYSADVVCLDLLQAGLAKIGNYWSSNLASVQQEHFASTVAVRRLNALILAAPPPSRKEKILLACAPREAHSFSILLLNFLLRYRHWPVVYLGANVPLIQMDEALGQVMPSLTIFTAQRLTTAVHLSEMLTQLNKDGGNFAYGGRIFNKHPEIQQYIPAYFLGESILDSLQEIERLLFDLPQPALAKKQISDQYQRWQKQFSLVALRVEAEIPFPATYEQHNKLSDLINGGLLFNDLSLISVELGEIIDAYRHQGYDLAELNRYLLDYRTRLATLWLTIGSEPFAKEHPLFKALEIKI